jgi:hypothetical protein
VRRVQLRDRPDRPGVVRHGVAGHRREQAAPDEQGRHRADREHDEPAREPAPAAAPVFGA